MRWQGESIVAGLSAEAVNDIFWSLVCQDEEWLRTEFEAIVSAAVAQPLSSTSSAVVAADCAPVPCGREGTRPKPAARGPVVEPNWQRERSPPLHRR